jgi:hypothetical protein
MKLTTRKQRIKFDVGVDLKARHRISSAFIGYKVREMSKLIHHTNTLTKHEHTLNHDGNQANRDTNWKPAFYDVEVGTGRTGFRPT